MPRRKSDIEIRPRFRVIKERRILLGPGKADLLDAIDRTGSIRQAAVDLGMSYMRAWTLVKTMNEGFTSPVVDSSRGGSGRGGASLTATGRTVLELYREMERESLAAIRGTTKKIDKLVK